MVFKFNYNFILKSICISFFSIFLFANILSAQTIVEKHPFILFNSEDIDSIIQRLDTPPYDSWHNRLNNEADQILALNKNWATESIIKKNTQAYYSKILAAAFFFSDSTDINHNIYGDEAAKILFYMPSENYKRDFFSSDLDVSETALYISEAYDLLKAGSYGFNITGFTNMERSIRNIFLKLRFYMAEDYSLFGTMGIANDFLSVAYLSQYHPERCDNHHVKLYSALTVLTLSIYSEPGSSTVFDKAKTRMLASIENMTITGSNDEPSGGWAEGPGYLVYAAHEFVPAINALVNMDIIELSDFTELINTNLLTAEMVMPDGYQPPFDDNEVSVFTYSGLLYSYYKNIPGRDMLGWLWNFNGKPVTNDILPDYLASFDNSLSDNVSPLSLGLKPSRFHPESGFACLRDSWDNKGTYMLLLSENGEARIKGQAHEHPDPNSIILHSRGELLTIDSGYGGFDKHNSTRKAVNHNLIFVNGEGPDPASQPGMLGFWEAKGSDAFLTDYFTTEKLDYAVSSTTYKGADFTRNILFPYHKYFLLYDRITSSSTKEYKLLLHGNGGGTSGGDYTDAANGGIWKKSNVSLRAYSVGSTDVSFETTDMDHAVYGRTPMLTHTVLKVVQNTSDGKYLTLLLPYSENEEIPAMESIATENAKGIHITYSDSSQYACFNLSDGNGMSFSTDNGDIISDSECVLVSYSSKTHPDDIFFKNGSSLDYAQGLITTSKTSTVTLDFRNYSVNGYIIVDGETTITLTGEIPSSVTFNGASINNQFSDGLLTFSVPGTGSFTVNWLFPPSNFTASDFPDDIGHKIQLSWSLSSDDDIIDGYKIYRSRIPEFTEPVIDINSIGSLEELIEKEQNSAILIADINCGVNAYLDNSIPLNGVEYNYWIVSYAGEVTSAKIKSGQITSVMKETPSEFSVNPPYPNPFNSTVTIDYYLPGETDISIDIFSSNGQKIETLINKIIGPGIHKISWDAAGMPSGVYFCKLTAGENIITRKLMLLK